MFGRRQKVTLGGGAGVQQPQTSYVNVVGRIVAMEVGYVGHVVLIDVQQGPDALFRLAASKKHMLKVIMKAYDSRVNVSLLVDAQPLARTLVLASDGQKKPYQWVKVLRLQATS